MTTTALKRQLQSLPEAERSNVIRAALPKLSPAALKTIERQLRRLAHPEVPEDVWVGFEEAEDGSGMVMEDKHFTNPPA
jgi:hypothetical protein